MGARRYSRRRWAGAGVGFVRGARAQAAAGMGPRLRDEPRSFAGVHGPPGGAPQPAGSTLMAGKEAARVCGLITGRWNWPVNQIGLGKGGRPDASRAACTMVLEAERGSRRFGLPSSRRISRPRLGGVQADARLQTEENGRRSHGRARPSRQHPPAVDTWFRSPASNVGAGHGGRRVGGVSRDRGPPRTVEARKPRSSAARKSRPTSIWTTPSVGRRLRRGVEAGCVHEQTGSSCAKPRPPRALGSLPRAKRCEGWGPRRDSPAAARGPPRRRFVKSGGGDPRSPTGRPRHDRGPWGRERESVSRRCAVPVL